MLDALWPEPRTDRLTRIHAQMRWLIRMESATPEERAQLQSILLRRVIRHHARCSPGYRKLLNAEGIQGSEVDGLDSLAHLPLTSRNHLEDPRIFATRVPSQDLPVSTLNTSGSAGRPLRLRHTESVRAMMGFLSLREYFWYGVDVGGRMADIRYHRDQVRGAPTAVVRRRWPLAHMLGVPTGEYLRVPIGMRISRQVEHLKRFRPTLICTYPTNLVALTDHIAGRAPDLFDEVRLIRLLGEKLSPWQLDHLRRFWRAPIADVYGAWEVGQIAISCPAGAGYHLQSENVIVEVLDPDGRPCPRGQTGRIVVTSLRNLAMPIIRYSLGDGVAPGGSCSCGRTLPLLQSVEGRVHDVIRLPGGESVTFYPSILYGHGVEGLTQAQLLQIDTETLEYRYVARGELDARAETEIATHIRSCCDHSFKIRFRHLDELPRGPGGKTPLFMRMHA